MDLELVKDDAYDEGYEQALLDIEERIAEISKTVLWDSSDLRDPATGRVPQSKQYRWIDQQGKAKGLRTAAKLCERLRQDG